MAWHSASPVLFFSVYLCMPPNSKPLAFLGQFSDAMPTLYKELKEQEGRGSGSRQQ
jgi:hypothetical protein